MRNKGDDKADLAFGCLCGLIFPMGGGVFTECSFEVGNWLPSLMGLN
jgi:hypothetical protein